MSNTTTGSKLAQSLRRAQDTKTTEDNTSLETKSVENLPLANTQSAVKKADKTANKPAASVSKPVAKKPIARKPAPKKPVPKPTSQKTTQPSAEKAPQETPPMMSARRVWPD